MAKARLSHRIFSLTMALLFFLTAFGFSFLVIWQLHQSNANSSTNSNTSQTNSKLPKLVGTKLSNYTPVSSVNSLQVSDQTPGSGQAVTSDNQTITVEYTGAVASTGTIFQSSLQDGQALTDPLNDLITGWQKGLIGMKVGGTRRLLIPASEGYGSNPPSGSGIPANAGLVFDITLLKVQ